MGDDQIRYVITRKNENKWTKLWIHNAKKGATKQTQRKRLIEIKSEIYKRKVDTTKKKS